MDCSFQKEKEKELNSYIKQALASVDETFIAHLQQGLNLIVKKYFNGYIFSKSGPLLGVIRHFARKNNIKEDFSDLFHLQTEYKAGGIKRSFKLTLLLKDMLKTDVANDGRNKCSDLLPNDYKDAMQGLNKVVRGIREYYRYENYGRNTVNKWSNKVNQFPKFFEENCKEQGHSDPTEPGLIEKALLEVMQILDVDEWEQVTSLAEYGVPEIIKDLKEAFGPAFDYVVKDFEIGVVDMAIIKDIKMKLEIILTNIQQRIIRIGVYGF